MIRGLKRHRAPSILSSGGVVPIFWWQDWPDEDVVGIGLAVANALVIQSVFTLAVQGEGVVGFSVDELVIIGWVFKCFWWDEFGYVSKFFRPIALGRVITSEADEQMDTSLHGELS